VALFDRAPGKITLTRAGEALLPEAERTLATFNGLLAKAREIKGQITGRVQIGTTEDHDFLRVGSLVGALIGALPLVSVSTRYLLAEDLYEGVLSGQLDAGFIIGASHHPDLRAVPLRGVSFRVVAPSAMGTKLARASWRDVAALPWIGAPARSHLYRAQKEIFSRHALAPNVVMECDDVSSLAGLVRAGVGLTMMREEEALAAAERGDLIVWGHAKSDMPLSFVHLASAEHDPVMIGVLSALAQAWGERVPLDIASPSPGDSPR
jgi:DNA-binding transcriptional LysR family regulator